MSVANSISSYRSDNAERVVAAGAAYVQPERLNDEFCRDSNGYL